MNRLKVPRARSQIEQRVVLLERPGLRNNARVREPSRHCVAEADYLDLAVAEVDSKDLGVR